jgi:hypothetical protein
MFGIGKIIDGVFGKFFDSIGLGWMTQALSLTANIMSGNWVGAAQDVFDLVAEFTDSSWMDRVASLQPLGGFDAQGCFGDILSEDTLGQWINVMGGEGGSVGKFLATANTVRETMQNTNTVLTNRAYALSQRPY